MIKHLTFSDKNMTNSARGCVESALHWGCDVSTAYRETNISKSFYNLFKDILDHPRGAGYWLWKPYFILKELEKANEGDYIIYTDAGVNFVNDVEHLIDDMDSDIMVFANGWRHGDWCKGDVLKGMNCEEFADEQQCQATCIILYKSTESIKFVEDWLECCLKPGWIDDSPSKEPNQPTFKEHRHDQAILTNLVYLNNITLNRWCAQYNLKGQEQFNNTYGVILHHHGLRNNGKRV
jgi:hypothetical protein